MTSQALTQGGLDVRVGSSHGLVLLGDSFAPFRISESPQC